MCNFSTHISRDSCWTCTVTGLMLLRAAKERRGETAMRAMADIFKICKCNQFLGLNFKAPNYTIAVLRQYVSLMSRVKHSHILWYGTAQPCCLNLIEITARSAWQQMGWTWYDMVTFCSFTRLPHFWADMQIWWSVWPRNMATACQQQPHQKEKRQKRRSWKTTRDRLSFKYRFLFYQGGSWKERGIFTFPNSILKYNNGLVLLRTKAK